jgi:cytochrome c-type biogenesis protein CcmH/NrfG
VADSILLYRKALAAEPNAAAWNELSVLSLDRGDSGQACAASLEALRLAPENPDYAVQYLRVAQAVYEPRRFMRELEQMRVRFPEALQITLALARANWQYEQNARNARMLYDEFLRKAPANHPMRADVQKERDALPAR